MNQQDPQVVFQELEQACYDLSSRGMHQAARWVAEQLSGLDQTTLDLASNAAESGNRAPLHTDATDRMPQYILAKEYFEFKEYQRAAHVLRGLQGPKALFLRCWCQYLAGEKRKEEARAEAAGGKGGLGEGTGATGGGTTARSAPTSGGLMLLSSAGASKDPINQELDGIEQELNAALSSGQADAFCAYLLGMVLLDKGQKHEAQNMLLLSLRNYPANWAAWLALQRLVVDARSMSCLPADSALLPLTHWACDFFIASVSLELQENMEALSRLQRLSHVFPQSLSVESMVAQAQYNLQNFEQAQALYEDLLQRDPHRLEGLDTYSNILFVKEQPAALSMLAHRAMSTDKYRVETCCVVGNYYSLKGSHEVAVSWFRRALRLQRSCLAAWTLMGHEYMEMKNTAAAVEAYRAAVELSPHDYRAWYGLGQAHELLKLPYYALYYYRRAAALRPSDARMWCALGQCYASAQVGNQDMAVRCFQKAVEQHDPEGVALHLLAKLRESRGELEEAERLFRANLARLDTQALEAGDAGVGMGASTLSSDAVEALLFLAGHCKATGRLSEATAFCERLLDVGGPPREHAKALAREIHALQASQQTSGVGPSSAVHGLDRGAQAADGRAAGSRQPAAAAAGLAAGPAAAVGHTPAMAPPGGMFGMGGSAATGSTAVGAGGGRNLFSALGHARADTAATGNTLRMEGVAERGHMSSGNMAITPVPAPLFGASPAPSSFYQGTPMSVAAPTPAANPATAYLHHQPETPMGSTVMSLADGRTPMSSDASMMQPAGRHGQGHVTGLPRWGDADQDSMQLGTPMTQIGSPSQTYTGGGSAPSVTPGQHAVHLARTDGPSVGAGRAGEAVAAVAQQLRIQEGHAAMLLAAAGGNPLIAIRNNLHLLGPAPHE